jgi:hypothetical protein
VYLADQALFNTGGFHVLQPVGFGLIFLGAT